MSDKQLNGDFSWDMLGDVQKGREHLGPAMPVLVYRLFQYTMRATLVREFSTEEMIRLFRKSGWLAGEEFAKNVLDLNTDWNEFLAQLQAKMKQLRIGVLRFEEMDKQTGHAILTIGEDLDCSGLPVTGECVCNYDEGFISGIMGAYTKKPYETVEVDCWARGDRVCRFETHPSET
ncbi:MAG: 4-vinyl reductase [Lachnospiraceae bacterium]|jgi:predicted hydrocarbon binding protein|nr:4-vinyl reductase [Lachnospiraceae bacterium]